MEKSFQVLEFDKVLEILSSFASSELGKQRCLVAQVYDDFSKISKELTYTSEARFLLNQFIEPPWANIQPSCGSWIAGRVRMRRGIRCSGRIKPAGSAATMCSSRSMSPISLRSPCIFLLSWMNKS